MTASKQGPSHPTGQAGSPRGPLGDPGTVSRFGDDLRAAGFTSTGVTELLGSSAHRALGRGEFAPALRATTGGSPRETLTRLFLLGSAEPAAAVARALPATGVPAALAEQILEPAESDRAGDDGSAVRAAVDVRPYAVDEREYLLVSDLDSDVRPGPVRPDHVLGLGAASLTLARATIRQPVERALDLGTGCGIQALQLSAHAGTVVATDTNDRALALARATAQLNGVEWDLRRGSLYEPVAGEQFDLIVCNPPFVIGDGQQRYSYRDSGLAGDQLCRTLIEHVATHLRPGGTAQFLANWMVPEGTRWRDRVAGWVDASGCDAWVIQREMADPAEYVGLWLADAGEDAKAAGAGRTAALHLAQQWLDYFVAERIEGIGMGLISLRRNDAHHPSVTLDEISGPDEEVTGDEIDGFFTRRRWVEGATDTDLLAARLVLSPQVVLEQRALAGHQGWSTVLRLLRRQGGPGASIQLDEWGQALLGGCTGAVPLAVQIDLLAAAHALSPGALTDAVLPAIRVAVLRGLLTPAPLPVRSGQKSWGPS